MKHYAYTLFQKTQEQLVHRYIIKYGSEASLREHLTTKWMGSDLNIIGYDPNKQDFQQAVIVRKTKGKEGGEVRDMKEPKKGEQRHGDVVIHGRWNNTDQSKRLEKVQPWDVLVVMGHGFQIGDTEQFLPDKCTSDDHSQTKTINDIVADFGAKYDNLNKQHVFIKLAMCGSGGPFGTNDAPTDCFAKQLAVALQAAKPAGWQNVLVGGFKGTMVSGRDKGTVGRGGDGIRFSCEHCRALVKMPVSMAGKKPACPTCKKIIQVPQANEGNKYYHWSQMQVVAYKNKVESALGKGPQLDSRDKLIYYKGDGTVLARPLVDSTKVILREYPADADKQTQINYLAGVRERITKLSPTELNDFPGKVLTMLEERLGVKGQAQTQSPVMNAPMQQVQPQSANAPTGGQQPAKGGGQQGQGKRVFRNGKWVYT